MTMGQIIRKLRKERNLTQEELAEQLNITAQAISRWENETGMPDISQIIPLSNVFGVSVNILFGTDEMDGAQAVEEFLHKLKKKLNNKPQGISTVEHRKSCVEEILSMQKTYPNNYLLIDNCLCQMVMLLWTYRDDRFTKEIPDRDAEMLRLQNECIRQANFIFHHCADIRYLNNAHRWMVSVYRIMGDYKKAEEHAQNLLDYNGFQLAVVYGDMGRTEDAIKQHSLNFYEKLRQLTPALPALGYLYWKQKDYEAAYACYRLQIDLLERIMGQGQIEEVYYPALYLNMTYDWCAATCVTLGRCDEAIDWLEKWFCIEQNNAQKGKSIERIEMPYFCGVGKDEQNISLQYSPRISKSLKWKSFDPIRENDRFRSLVTRVNMFETEDLAKKHRDK